MNELEQSPEEFARQAWLVWKGIAGPAKTEEKFRGLVEGVVKAALKAHSDWLAEQGLVVAPLAPTVRQAQSSVAELPESIARNAHFEGEDHER